jgi:ureidoglycolate hydrolase
MAGDTIARPLSHSSISTAGLQLISVPSSPSAAQQGNQGTALVARRLTCFPSSYDSAPSGKPSSCNTAYFRCAPRPVFQDNRGRTGLQIKVFERHAYTRQAFFPMGVDGRRRAYVVVVAEDKGGWHNTICLW